MVKFAALKKDGGAFIGLGITEENVASLKEGRPMMIRISELGLPATISQADVMLFYGETTEKIESQIQALIAVDMLVSDSCRKVEDN